MNGSAQSSDLPNFISLQDLLLLEQLLDNQNSILKSLHQRMGQAQNTQLQNLFDTVGKMHQRHYIMLLRHLQPIQQSSPQASVNPQMQF